MIIFATLLLLCCMMAWGRTQYRPRPGEVRLHTFVVDPPTMLIVGLLMPLLGLLTRKGRKLAREQFQSRKRRIDRGLWLFLIGFWTLELLTYFNVMGHPFDPTRSGNDFMINGYAEWIAGRIYDGPFPIYTQWWSWPLLAAMLLLQFGALRLGRAIGYMQAYFNDMDNWAKPARPQPAPAPPTPTAATTAPAAPPASGAGHS